jgi:hypothetical protein
MSDERYAEYMEETPKTWIQGLFEESATQKHPLGCVRKLADGREFVYAKMGATVANQGSLYQGEAFVVANAGNLAVTANAAKGERAISFTLGNTDILTVANEGAEGYIHVSGANLADGGGHAYKIKNHAAIVANANGTVYLYDKIRANIAAATSKISITKNPYKDVVKTTGTDATGAIAGVATSNVTANYFCWLQKRGPCAMEVCGTFIVGDVVTPGANDGSAGISAANQVPIGSVMANNADASFALIDLKL